jgi:hypothetical protein
MDATTAWLHLTRLPHASLFFASFYICALPCPLRRLGRLLHAILRSFPSLPFSFLRSLTYCVTSHIPPFVPCIFISPLFPLFFHYLFLRLDTPTVQHTTYTK